MAKQKIWNYGGPFPSWRWETPEETLIRESGYHGDPIDPKVAELGRGILSNERGQEILNVFKKHEN